MGAIEATQWALSVRPGSLDPVARLVLVLMASESHDEDHVPYAVGEFATAAWAPIVGANRLAVLEAMGRLADEGLIDPTHAPGQYALTPNDPKGRG